MVRALILADVWCFESRVVRQLAALLVLVTPLADKAQALEYHSLFMGNPDLLTGINNMGFPSFAITPENYALLYKSKDIAGYEVYFQENYLDGQ